MKKFTLFLILIILGTQLCSQELSGLESPELDNRYLDANYIPKVSGQLINYSQEIDSGLFIKYVIVTPNNQVTKTAEIANNGEFSLSLDNALPYQEIYLSIGDHYYGKLIANTELIINADLNLIRGKDVRFNADGIVFEGKDGLLSHDANKFIAYERKQQLQLNKQLQILTRNRNLTGVEKTKRLNSIYEKLALLEENYLKETPTENEWMLDNERLSDYYSNIFLAHWGKPMNDSLFQAAVAHKPLLVSNASTAYYRNLGTFLKVENPEERISNIEKTIPSLIMIEEKKGFEQYLLEYKKRINNESYDTVLVKKGSQDYLVKYKEELEEVRLDEFISKLSKLPKRKFDITGLIAQPEDLEQRAVYLSKLLPRMKDNWARKLMNIKLLSDNLEQVMISQKLNSASEITSSKSLGEPLLSLSTGADLYLANQENVDLMLASILKTYKDEAIILDVWATWCAPCIKDMKDSKAIKKQLGQMPVKVIYLCVENNSSEEKWKKKVAELDLSGDHIFMNSKLSAELMSQFKLGGFPSYLFINRKREIDKYYIQGISKIDIKDLKKKI